MFNNSSYSNLGIYRHALEDIMFTPNRESKKKEFHDETLASIKKVSKLREKFESGDLDLTVEEKELESVAEIAEDFCDGPATNAEPRTSTPINSVHDNKEESEEEKHTADVFFENQYPMKTITETPILRTISRQVSGCSVIETHVRSSRLNVENSPQPNRSAATNGTSRQKTVSSGSSCSSGSASSSSSNYRSDSSFYGGNDFTVNNQFYYSKLARAQVHKKFSSYFKWKTETLRSIAATVSQMRLETLNEIPENSQDDRVRIMKRIYENCKKGVNKEMDALCCALFDLLGNVDEKCLSNHEEYVAVKYTKKFHNQTSMSP